MRQRLLDFLACPDCHSSALSLKVIKSHGGGVEIVEGSLDCAGCGQQFLVKEGIARMLPRDLREATETTCSNIEDGTLLTCLGYDYQHQRKGNDNLQEKLTTPWHAANLQLSRQLFLDYLSLDDTQTASLKGSVVLDGGCGAGRYMAVVREYGVLDVVGIDLSVGGLLKAKSLLSNDGNNGNYHLVQGDITRPPFKKEIFDTIFSIGVLHHLKTPEKGFQALKSLLSPGGQFWIWVYGLESMSLSYRISHLTWLRRITDTWSLSEKYHLCQKLAFIFRLVYLYPLRLLNKVLPARFKSRLPFNDWAYQGKNDIAYGFLDRLQPPYVHYLTKEQLQQYVADLKEVAISNPKKHGWVVKGQKL